MGFLLFLPFVAAIIGIFVVLLIFMGVCLLIIGGTGIAMNKLNAKLTQTTKRVAKPLYNAGALIFGAMLILAPLGVALYAVISSIMNQ